VRRVGFFVLLLVSTTAFAETESSEEKFPQSRALVRTLLEQANDPALQAQKKYFPEHYDALVTQLVELQRQDNSREASELLVEVSNRNWARYNKLVRQGTPEDWKALVVMRRDLFASIAEQHGASLCMSYEYKGTQALTGPGRESYQPAVSAYIAKFLAAAAAARENPAQWDDVRKEDLELLYEAASASGTEPELLRALRPHGEIHPRFCEAMVTMLNAALGLEGKPAMRIWRFLVTVPAESEPATP